MSEIDWATARRQLGRQGLLGYEELHSLDDRDVRYEADQIRTVGWRLGNRPPAPVEPPIPWESMFADHRSHAFHLHSWDFLEPALRAIGAAEEDTDLLQYAVAVAVDWAEAHPRFAPDGGMAWYDMAIGLRAVRLAYVIDLLSRLPEPDSRLQILLRSAEEHRLAFTQHGMFKPHHNHGLFVAAGQAALGRRLSGLPGMDDAEVEGRQRLEQMLTTQFTEEGVHVEHSPGYHLMVLQVVRGLWRAGLLPAGARQRIAAIEDALAWFVLPDGTLAPVGDTDRTTLCAAEGIVDSSHLLWITSGASGGEPPVETWRSFPLSGYACLKDGWIGDESSEHSYLLHTAAFHSRAHKHADDQSIIWFDRGEEILTDPGRFAYLDPGGPDSELGRLGFFYQDPRRVFSEETGSHSTVEVDAMSFRRRGVPPYGSGLRAAGATAGLLYSDAFVEHQVVLGSVRIRHRRLVLFDPGQWLLVVDELDPSDGMEHRYAQSFVFAPQIEVASSDLGWKARLRRGDRLWVVPISTYDSVELQRGETEPKLKGWVAADPDTLVPASSIAVIRAASGPVTMTTLFAFSDDPATPLPASSESGADTQFEWIAFGRLHRIQVGRQPGSFDYELA